VEPDERAAKRLVEMLNRPEGATRFDITRVTHVDQALTILQNASLDVMLLDLSPDEGYGLDSLLRARIASRSIPIVVLTYHRDETVALKAARAGAQDYLTKGEVTPELVSRTLVHAVERHRILRELTEAHRRQHFMATHDALTELPNRFAFLQELQTAVADAERQGKELAVMFFDLDGFKAVNDNRGHAAGDELLVDVARRLRHMVRKSDLLARLGGDEFVAAFRNIRDEATILELADRFREEIERPYHVGGVECWISMSVGIAFYPRHSEDPNALVRCADIAMYQVKAGGRNQARVFDHDMDTAARDRYELASGLRDSLHSGQLLLNYQPQFDLLSEEMVGVEALLRWNHPTRGIVSPAEFIEAAEQTGLIVPMGEWVLRTACATVMDWTEWPELRVAVNISGRQLDQVDFPDRVGRILQETGLEPGRLEIELTESLAASDRAIFALGKLREIGVRVAIDDFGTGYSSLTLLKRLPIDVLKIDQSFVRGATSSRGDGVILQAVIDIARGLDLDVLAEGVETVEERDLLWDKGCTLMQGYLLSKPLPRQEILPTLSPDDAAWRAHVDVGGAWAPGARSASDPPGAGSGDG
jgi:diguanylate cyclase (GGDEF)-like protein